jgi:hypothetical protein
VYKQEFVMRLQTSSNVLKSEYERSPIPIYEWSRHDWLCHCKANSLPFPSDFGTFYYANDTADLPSQFVVIDRNLPNFKKVAICRHELAHHDCYSNGCECFETDKSAVGDCEFHATVKAMVELLNESLYAPLLFTMESVIRSLFRSRKIPFYAAVKVVRNPIWSDAEDVGGEKYLNWLERHPFVRGKLDAIRM